MRTSGRAVLELRTAADQARRDPSGSGSAWPPVARRRRRDPRSTAPRLTSTGGCRGGSGSQRRRGSSAPRCAQQCAVPPKVAEELPCVRRLRRPSAFQSSTGARRTSRCRRTSVDTNGRQARARCRTGSTWAILMRGHGAIDDLDVERSQASRKASPAAAAMRDDVREVGRRAAARWTSSCRTIRTRGDSRPPAAATRPQRMSGEPRRRRRGTRRRRPCAPSAS